MIQNWKCAYCGTFTTLNEGDVTDDSASLNDRSKNEKRRLRVVSASCPNPQCRELTVNVEMREFQRRPNGGLQWGTVHLQRRIMPEGSVMPLPDSIPEAVRKTYREAVLVCPISGAASAALSRRCLQGIVRDFFQIPSNHRGELGAELSYVKDQIDAQIWADIQAVRAVGDIGAHMDKNVDFIVDVDTDEAALLIGLIEELFKVWYIERDRRAAQSGNLNKLLAAKRQQQKEAKIAAKGIELAQPTSPAISEQPESDATSQEV